MMKGLDHQNHELSAHYRKKAKWSSLSMFVVGVGSFIGAFLFSTQTLTVFETTTPVMIKVAGDDFSNLKWLNTSYNMNDRAPASLKKLTAEDSVAIALSFTQSKCNFKEIKEKAVGMLANTKAEHVLVAVTDPIQAVQACGFANEEQAAKAFWEVVGHIKDTTGKRVHGGIIQARASLEDQEMLLALVNMYRETGEREGHAIRYVGVKGFEKGSATPASVALSKFNLVEHFCSKNSIVIQAIES